MTDQSIVRLADAPEWLEQAAEWFHGKWHVPVEAYRESMEESLRGENPVPQWYLMVEQQRIIGGMGVIENDFHDRRDLTPNLCALYVEAPFRGRGLAGELLAFARREMSAGGVKRLYLATDLVSFYERYGWSYLTHARDDCGGTIRIYTVECRKIF